MLYPNLQIELEFLPAVTTEERFDLVTTGIENADGKYYTFHMLPTLIAEYWGRLRVPPDAMGYRPVPHPVTKDGRIYRITEPFGWNNTPQGHGFWTYWDSRVTFRVVEKKHHEQQRSAQV